MSHKAVLVPVGDKPEFVEVDGYKSLQKLVGGCIESVSWIFDDAISVYANDEGKSLCNPNRAIYAQPQHVGKIGWDGEEIVEGKLLDIIFGDFVCVGFDPETGEDRDLTDDEIQLIMERFGSVASIKSGLIETLKIMARA